MDSKKPHKVTGAHPGRVSAKPGAVGGRTSGKTYKRY